MDQYHLIYAFFNRAQNRKLLLSQSDGLNMLGKSRLPCP